MKLIVPIVDVRSSDVSLVGGKGAQLGELVSSGMPVPGGFVVTTTAFDKFGGGEVSN